MQSETRSVMQANKYALHSPAYWSATVAIQQALCMVPLRRSAAELVG
jgi:hypothetical protein